MPPRAPIADPVAEAMADPKSDPKADPNATVETGTARCTRCGTMYEQGDENERCRYHTGRYEPNGGGGTPIPGSELLLTEMTVRAHIAKARSVF